MDFGGFWWILVDFGGFLWIYMDFGEVAWILVDLVDFCGFCGFTRSRGHLVGISWASRGHLSVRTPNRRLTDT